MEKKQIGPATEDQVRAIKTDEPITQAQLDFILSLCQREDVPPKQRKFLSKYLTRPNKTRMGARKVIWVTKQIVDGTFVSKSL